MKFINGKKATGGLTLAAVALLAVVVAAANGFSQAAGHTGGKHGGRGRHDGVAGHLFRGLDLTDAQQTQIKQIAARYHESTASLREQLRASRNAEADVLNGGAFNEQAVRAAAQSRAAAQVELEVAHARMFSEMYAVLTAEQKTKLAERRAQFEQRKQQWQQRRSPGATPSNVQ